MKKTIIFLIVFVALLSMVNYAVAAELPKTNVASSPYVQNQPDYLGNAPFIWATEDTMPNGAGVNYFDVDLSKVAGGIPRFVEIYYNRGAIIRSTGADTAAQNMNFRILFGINNGAFKQWTSDSVSIAAGTEGAAYSTQASGRWSTATGIGTGKFPGSAAGGMLVDSMTTSRVDTGSTNAGQSWTKTFIPKSFNFMRVYYYSAAATTALSSQQKFRMTVVALPGSPTNIREPYFPAIRSKFDK